MAPRLRLDVECVLFPVEVGVLGVLHGNSFLALPSWKSSDRPGSQIRLNRLSHPISRK